MSLLTVKNTDTKDAKEKNYFMISKHETSFHYIPYTYGSMLWYDEIWQNHCWVKHTVAHKYIYKLLARNR